MDEVIAAKKELGKESLDNTTAQCVAGKHLATMSDASRATVAQKLNKTVKSARNKAVKEAVFDKEYTYSESVGMYCGAPKTKPSYSSINYGSCLQKNFVRGRGIECSSKSR